ncbi:MAG: hypothetical protein GKC05_05025 [Methanomicrobiales archaeon]|nr:hypothetical protein [Methanomicrobiales archaeon]
MSVIVVCLILSAGCSSPPADTGGKPQPPGILVQYQRTGGIAGFNDQMVVFENGQVVYSRNTGSGTFTLTEDSLGELEELLEAADFPSLAPDYPAENPGADYFFYVITYDGTTVTAETGGEPPELIPVIMRLDTLLAEHS